MREPIKTKFTWDGLDDGVTSAICNLCVYNIRTYYCNHYVEGD